MQEFDKIGEDLFNKIRGRFPSITIGNETGEVTNEPTQARFFDFEYKEGDNILGNVSVNITEDSGMTIIFSKDFISNEDQLTKDKWYSFLKELRLFAKKRMMEFAIRDITKSNLTKRDYKFLSKKQVGDEPMAESKLYGTSKISYQDIDNARLVIKHTESVNQEQASGRTRSVGKIYIESADGERFMYPYKHLNGARAMGRHVAEGGKPFDEFGKHIISLSEEMGKLRKFKNYMGRSAVMAEGLSDYTSVVNDRIKDVKKTIENIQKESQYKKIAETFVKPVLEDVPSDVAENWIDQLTIKQFNEELKDVFPYIYKLVSEATKASELTADDLLDESKEVMICKDCGDEMHKPTTDCKHDCDDEQGSNWKAKVAEGEREPPAGKYKILPGDTIYKIAQRFVGPNYMDGDVNKFVDEIMKDNGIDDPTELQIGQVIQMPHHGGSGPDGGTRGFADTVDVNMPNTDEEIDAAFEKAMGQFADEEHEPEKPQLPVTEYIMSMYDRETGAFPKGETAILTAVEKDYGEQFIEPCKNFIERMHTTFAEHAESDDLERTAVHNEQEDEQHAHQDDNMEELTRIRELSGI